MKKHCWFWLVLLIGAFYAGVDANTDNTGSSAGNGQKDIVVKPTITLATNGTSDYDIVVPDGDDPQDRVKKASDLLQSILAEAVGCKLPVVREAEAPADKPHIYLGKTKAAKEAGLPVDKLKPEDMSKAWTFYKRVDGKNVFLVGWDASANITTRPDYLGTLKAVTSFLEDEVGVRFLLPGTNGIYVPKLGELKVDAALNVTAVPKIPYCYGRFMREYDPHDRIKFYDIYDVANNHFDMMYYKNYGGHSYYDAVPMLKYAETHPEYFALVNGKRLSTITRTVSGTSEPGHLCISNPEVQELMLKEMEKQFNLGYEIVQLSQTDGYQACECDKCKALTAGCREYDGTGALAQYGNPEALWIVHRKLAEQMKKRRPGKRIEINSYGPTAKPPRAFTKFPDNVVIKLTSCTPENFEMWKKFNVKVELVTVYNWGWYHSLGFLPKRTPAFVGKQVRLLAANDVKGVYKMGFGESLGLEGPVYYVFSKLLFDPSADPDVLANDFYRAAYGKAFVPMKTFFDAMHKQLELYSNIPRQDDPKLSNNPEDVICYFFPPELIFLMDDNLKRAFKMDDDPRVQARLRLVEREFLHLKNLAAIFAYYRAYRLSGSSAVFDLLEAELDKRNALIDSWYVENEKAKTNPKAPKWIGKIEDGWSCCFTFSGKDEVKKVSWQGVSGKLSIPPFTWDMKKMREAREKSGWSTVKPKSLRAVRLAQPPVMNGVADEEIWKKAPMEQLGEASLGVLKEGTSFQVAYDEANIYFAFVCKFADIDQAKFVPCGHDGPCWRSECLEIFLDPYGIRAKNYHFIFNPVPDSFYEARVGFIDDYLHPLFGKEDESWNGAWEYVAKVDRENKCWRAVMKVPFTTLGVSAPKPGTKWTMNIGREHYYLNKETGKPDRELSTWSPNPEEGGFGNISKFGMLEFE